MLCDVIFQSKTAATRYAMPVPDSRMLKITARNETVLPKGDKIPSVFSKLNSSLRMLRNLGANINNIHRNNTTSRANMHYIACNIGNIQRNMNNIRGNMRNSARILCNLRANIGNSAKKLLMLRHNINNLHCNNTMLRTNMHNIARNIGNLQRNMHKTARKQTTHARVHIKCSPIPLSSNIVRNAVKGQSATLPFNKRHLKTGRHQTHCSINPCWLLKPPLEGWGWLLVYPPKGLQ